MPARRIASALLSVASIVQLVGSAPAASQIRAWISRPTARMRPLMDRTPGAMVLENFGTSRLFTPPERRTSSICQGSVWGLAPGKVLT